MRRIELKRGGSTDFFKMETSLSMGQLILTAQSTFLKELFKTLSNGEIAKIDGVGPVYGVRSNLVSGLSFDLGPRGLPTDRGVVYCPWLLSPKLDIGITYTYASDLLTKSISYRFDRVMERVVADLWKTYFIPFNSSLKLSVTMPVVDIPGNGDLDPPPYDDEVSPVDDEEDDPPEGN